MAGRGGYQPPANPAPVSGPGALSRRTDGGQPVRTLPNARYGENAQFTQMQQGAPLSTGPQVPTTPTGGTGQPGFAANPAAGGVIPFNAPTNRPGEPVTAGAALGPGRGPSTSPPPSVDQQDLVHLAPYLPAFQVMANLPSSSPSSRALVNYLQGNGPVTR